MASRIEVISREIDQTKTLAKSRKKAIVDALAASSPMAGMEALLEYAFTDPQLLEALKARGAQKTVTV